MTSQLTARLAPSTILLHSAAQNLRELLQSMLAALSPCRSVQLPADLLEQILAREAEGGTELGNGVSIPHSRIAGLGEPVVAVASPQKRSGLDKLYFLILTDAASPMTHLQLLAEVARAVSVPGAVNTLTGVDSPHSFLTHLEQLLSHE